METHPELLNDARRVYPKHPKDAVVQENTSRIGMGVSEQAVKSGIVPDHEPQNIPPTDIRATHSLIVPPVT